MRANYTTYPAAPERDPAQIAMTAANPVTATLTMPDTNMTPRAVHMPASNSRNTNRAAASRTATSVKVDWWASNRRRRGERSSNTGSTSKQYRHVVSSSAHPARAHSPGAGYLALEPVLQPPLGPVPKSPPMPREVP